MGKWVVNVLSWLLNIGWGHGVWNEVTWKEVIACVTQSASVFWVHIFWAWDPFCSISRGWGTHYYIFAYCGFCFMKLGTMFNDVISSCVVFFLSALICRYFFQIQSKVGVDIRCSLVLGSFEHNFSCTFVCLLSTL